MNQTCTNLATKQEIETLQGYITHELEQKIPKTQEAAIYGNALSVSSQLINAGLATQGARIANALESGKKTRKVAETASRSAKGAGAAAKAARKAAEKANFEALYAQNRAAAARGAAASNAGKIGQALGTIGGLVAIIGTLATATQLAILTKQVAELIQRQTKFENDTKKRFVELQNTADSALTISRTNRENILQNKIRLNEQNAAINANEGKIIKTNTRITEVEQQITVLRGRFDSVNENIANVNKRVSEVNQKANTIDNANITNLNKTVDRLQTQNIQAQSKIDSLQQQLTKFQLAEQNQNKKITDLELKTEELNNDQVDKQQFNIINKKLDKIDKKVPKLITPTNIAFAVAGLDVVRQIFQRASQISPCQAPVLIPPVVVQTTATNSTLIGFQTASLAQTTAIQKTVTITKNVVTHAKHGLEGIKKAADIAWKATHADKALQMLNTAILISNAIHLGSGTLNTLGDAASIILSGLSNRITDSTGASVDVNAIVGKTVKTWVTSLIGQTTYTQLEQKIKLRIRTYQATANMLNSVRSMTASTREIAEETGVDVAKIGNALRLDGVVDYDSYDPMAENPRGLGKVLSALDKGDDIADSFLNVTQELQDIGEQAKEFNQERKQVKDLLKEEKETKVIQQVKQDKAIENLAEPTETDKLQSEES